MGVELRHLRCFVAIAECGQVSEAAQGLHVAQPALSQTLRQLERELGVALFERHPRGMRLTAAGADLLPHALAAVRDTDRAIATGRAHARNRRSELRIGFLPPLTGIASRILAAFEREQAMATIAIHPLCFGDHLRAVSRREVDVALVWAGRREPDVALEALLEEPLAACLSAGHALAGRRGLRFAQVEHEPIARLPDGSPTMIGEWPSLGAGRRPPRQADQAPGSVDELVWLIMSGRAVWLGPLSVAEALTRQGIVTIPLIDVDPVTISLARRRDDHRPTVGALSRIARRTAGPGWGHGTEIAGADPRSG